MKKRFLSLALAAAMAASLTACGGAGSDTQATTQSEASDAAGAPAASEATEAPAASDGATWKIGAIGPLTGGAAIYGNAVVNGAQIAVDEINAAGGINGFQIEYMSADDEHDAEKAVNAYNSLKDKGMQLLVGTTTSNPCIAVADKTAADNMFQITPSGSAVECAANPNVFRVCFSDPDQGVASAKYIGEHKLATKIAVIYDSSDVYSSGIYAKFAAEADSQGLEIVAEEAFTADTNKDFTTQLQKAKDAGAELVFLPFYYTEAALVLTQANTMGWDPLFFGCDGMDGILGVENFDTSLAEGLMLLTPFAADAEDDLTVNFVTTYKEKYSDIPNQFAADSYDAVYALKAALEDANANPEMSVSDICEAVKASMVKISVDGLTGAGMTWNAEGEPSKAPKAVKIENGAYVSME